MNKPTPDPSAAGWQAGFEQWADQLARLNRSVDPFGIGASMTKVSQGWLTHPTELAVALADFTRELQKMQLDEWQAAAGLQKRPHSAAAADDERFTDPAWSEVPALSIIKQYYLLYTHWSQEALFETPGVPQEDRRRATFWARQWLNAVAPTNFFLTNPVAIRKFWESGGQSLTAGLKLWLEDMRAGDVRMVDASAFKVGQNIATTPGSVVYRNELIELIQYAPATAEVHTVPLVIVPPWINKYYILDLNEKKSLLRYLVSQGYTVFVVSWKNPTALQSDTTFDDYLMTGLRQAIEVARGICGTPHVHAAGYCIGGTALAAMMGWFNREFPDAAQVPVSHWSLLTTLVDFSRPGGIEVFIDEKTIDTLEEMMAHQGYLDGKDMGRSFRMLRSNSLIWHYFVHNYLYGETPPPFDVLYWNTDVTRMPRAMHSFYLREFYLNNKLIKKDALQLAGHPIDLGRIRQPLYAVGCEEDHIAPWKAAFKIAGRIKAPVRYTLSSSGHILGIINPPVQPPKRSYWSGATSSAPPEEWLKGQHRIEGSWWEDWSAWLGGHCGEKVPARTPGSRDYPVLGPAPGSYVHEI
ncbi:MAG: class I poly(R)-hydroxyalkanoic acid synthase [Burkholderiales bacterium]|nr:class I poly(R)-hydroxyalkanoic acid synthase [Burkholderiales bacterium]